MNTRTLTILGGATALVAILAVVTLRGRESAVRATPVGGKLFPDLAAKVNDAAAIEVRRHDGTATLTRTGESWGLVEKGGYPVQTSAVRKSLVGLVNLTVAEEKTSDPANYAKLGVDDPSTEGSTAALVTVRDASGAAIASLIVGKERAGRGFSGTQQVYVRKPEEARSWLANGELGLHEKPVDWLDKKILEVKRDRVRAVEVAHADGETVRVDRDRPETNDFTLHEIPAGQEVSYPSAPGTLGSALEWLDLEDVVPASEVDAKEGATATTKFSCFDGLTVTVTTKNVGDKTYARFEASYEAPAESSGPAPAPAPDAEPAAEPGAEHAEDGHDHAAEEPKAAPKSREEVEKEVAALNAKLGGWTFVVPAYNKSSFQKKKSELLKEAVPPAEAPQETPPAPGDPAPPDAPPPDPVTPPETPPTPPETPPETPPQPPR